MSIFSRLSDIVNANINALLEKAEDPEKIIRLMIQEMEDTLVELRSAAAKTIAEKKERQRRIEWLEQEQIDWERKAELALQKDREDLAKAALLEKAHVSDQIEALNKELGVVEQQLEKLNGDIGKLQNKLTDAKNRQRTLVMRHKHAGHQLRARGQLHDSKLDDVLHRFESAERRIEEAESRVEAYDMGRKKGLSDEFSEIEANERVSDELEALKARVRGGGKPPADKQ